MSHAVEARTVEFGAPGGSRMPAVELSNAAGMHVRVLALGASLQSLSAPDRDGRSGDVVLGHSSLEEYAAKRQFLGASIGRYANRIAHGRFVLDGAPYTLDCNDGPNHLHGGERGFDRVAWRIERTESGAQARAVLSHASPNGEGGYPGAVSVVATYALKSSNELSIEYRARTDRPTLINLTNHAYFNLEGEASGLDVMEHRLTLYADEYTPIDATSIPTGERRRLAGTAFDFRKPRAIGAHIREPDEQLRFGQGYDHNFIVRGESGALRPVARLEAPSSGRVLELFSTAPGVQFYSGNMLDGTTVGKSGRPHARRTGLCLEPQAFPDSPNRPEFPSVRLEPDEEYVHLIVFRFSATP